MKYRRKKLNSPKDEKCPLRGLPRCGLKTQTKNPYFFFAGAFLAGAAFFAGAAFLAAFAGFFAGIANLQA